MPGDGTIDKITSGEQTSLGSRFQKRESQTSIQNRGIDSITGSGKLTSGQRKALDNLQKFLVTPTCFISAGAGALSMISTHLFKRQNDIVDKIATYGSKAAVYAVAIFSSLNRAWLKDTIGTLAFSSDIITTTLATGEDLYQWKGYGSGSDHGPLILGEIHSNPKVKNRKKYQLTKGKEKEEFIDYKSFLDSAEKMLYSVSVVIGDIFKEFKDNDPVKAFKRCFISGDRKAEKNLLVSGLGIIGGAFLSTVLGFKRVGSTIRDVFGLYADWAYVDKGLSEVSDDKGKSKEINEKTKKYKMYYTRGGIEYIIGSILDLIYRWTGLEGLNFLALGVDRLGARDAALGIVTEAEVGSKQSTDNAAQNIYPRLAA